MHKATVTSKGQITLPKEIRDGLNIERGDKLLFELHGDEVIMRVLHARSVDDLFEALAGASAYRGEEAEAEAVRAAALRKNRP